MAEIVPNNHKELGIKAKEEVMIVELEVSPIDARYYFETRTMGLRWYNYDDLKELMYLRQTTAVIRYLPMRLVMLLAADVAEMNPVADASEMRMAA
jgi:hypothetical protein